MLRQLRYALATMGFVAAATVLTASISYAQSATSDSGNAHCTVYVPPLPAHDPTTPAPQIDLSTTCLSAGAIQTSALVGLAALVVLAVIIAIALGGKSPLDLVLGADGRPSTSILQFYLWTVFAVFAFVSVWVARWIGAQLSNAPDFPSPPAIPTNLLIAMGLSVTTFVAARGITSSQVQAGAVSKGGSGTGGIVTDDSGMPDLGKVQLMIWTAIALTASIASLQFNLTHNPIARLDLPDIDATLMVLMGLGQGAYLGKKLIVNGSPVISSSSATGSQVHASDRVVLTGSGFGDSRGNSLLIFDDRVDVPIATSAGDWSASQITFAVPALDPRTAQAWTDTSPPVGVSVIVNGRQSNASMLTVVATPAQSGNGQRATTRVTTVRA